MNMSSLCNGENVSTLTHCESFPQMQKEQYEEEKTRLARESDQIKEENKDLKSKLQQQMEETDRLKVCCQPEYENWR